jgi:hypothetical protein
MMDSSSSPGGSDTRKFEEALSVFQEYLSDQVAPLLLVDEAEVLTSAPASLLATEIQKWISLQYRSAGDPTPVSDYLYHVARKIQHVRELQLLPEGMRRVDEFRQAEALIPEGAAYVATGKKPTRVEDEGDESFLRELWRKASSGIPAIQCEKEFPVDAYRIRRCFEHWLQEGALSAKVQ